MCSNIFISQIILNNFRSHQNFSINTNSKNIVLYGENGAGKTNILESVSLLSPGRGLRNAKSEEIINKKNGLNFALTSNVNFNDSTLAGRLANPIPHSSTANCPPKLNF